MNHQLLTVLEPADLESILNSAATQTFRDGRNTASGLARDVKNNLQSEGPASADTAGIILAALTRNQTFQNFALPKRMTTPALARYELGMEYGSHVDSALMGEGGGRLRCDLAMTLFLSPADSYDGGELVIETGAGEQEIKLDAGEAIVYSATSLHRVTPVTRGVRLVAIAWLESMVPDEGLRTILFDLWRAITAGPSREVTQLLSKSYHNLLRYSARP